MSQTINAIFENGVFKPTQKIRLKDKQKVQIQILSEDDWQKRFDRALKSIRSKAAQFSPEEIEADIEEAMSAQKYLMKLLVLIAFVAILGVTGGCSGLNRAIHRGDISEVQKLLDEGADVNAKNFGNTALILAIENGHTDIAKLLIDRGANVNETGGLYEFQPLNLAAIYGHTAIVKLLIDRGADVNAKNKYGNTPLIHALHNGHTEIAKLLLDRGAEVPSGAAILVCSNNLYINNESIWKILSPGSHVIPVTYWEVSGNRQRWSTSPFLLSIFAESGGIYIAKGQIQKRPKEKLFSSSPGQWRVWVEKFESKTENKQPPSSPFSKGESKDPTTGMEFVYVDGGCYQMGDTFGDGESNEKPVHEVCVDDFYIGKYEVTQGQWKAIMRDNPLGDNPSKFDECGDNCPVESVSWNDAQAFINKLNNKTGKNYRLPTEAEWEYAAKSGGKSEKYSGGNDVDSVAWYKDNSEKKHIPLEQNNRTAWESMT